jgi:hypothetical protein
MKIHRCSTDKLVSKTAEALQLYITKGIIIFENKVFYNISKHFYLYKKRENRRVNLLHNEPHYFRLGLCS